MSERDGAVRETAPALGAGVEPAVLDDLVQRVVHAVQPERILLFGSAARGTMTSDSDVDLLVVKSGNYRRLEIMHEIRRHLRGLGIAVDLVIATPEELVRYGDHPSLIYSSALRDGREVYAAR